MRKAVIDLGTNTFNLLIAETSHDNLQVLYVAREAVLLGMGGINEGLITEDALKRAIEALTVFKEKCTQLSVQKIVAIGTSALRSAANARQFVTKVERNLGIQIQIIDGKEEARLIYEGTKWGYSFQEPSVIMDIGGGSTEYIAADNSGVNLLTSLDIGVSRIFQFMKKPKQYDEKSQASIITFLNEKGDDFFENTKADVLVGASGSFETFYEMIYQQQFSMEEAKELEMKALKEVLDWTIESSLKERMENKWIIPMRKEMLPIAAMKIKWTLEKLGIKKVYVSPYSLKEGALAE